MPRRLFIHLFPILAIALFVALAWNGAWWMSMTFDEPGHLVAGLAISRGADFRFGPNHPPLIRYWFTLPNLLDPSTALPVDEPAYREGRQRSTAMLLADRADSRQMVRRGRFMVILLAAALGLLLWRWSVGLFGVGAAAVVMLLFILEPNLMAHGSLMSTDMGITLFFALTLYFLRQVFLRLTPVALAGLSLAFAAAQLSKFSAVVLWPAVAVVLVWRALDGSPWEAGRGDRTHRIAGRCRKSAAAAAVMVLLGGVFLASAWGAYGFRYSIAPKPGLAVDFSQDEEFGVNDRAMGRTLDRIRFLPEAYVRGGAQILTWPKKPYYLAGKVREQPVWWFFPVALLVKTPTALLALSFLGIWLAVRRRELRPPGWPALLIPTASFLAAAIASGQTTGIRHILPIYPFLILCAGLAASRLLAGRSGRIVMALLALVTVAEFTLAYPDTIAAFNLPSGGPSRGDRWLVDSNMDYGQTAMNVKRWMDDNGIREMNLALHTPYDLSEVAGTFQLPVYNQPLRRVDPPSLPGYVAIGVSVLRGYTGGQGLAEFYAPFLRMEPVAVIGHSIRIYWVERPWW